MWWPGKKTLRHSSGETEKDGFQRKKLAYVYILMETYIGSLGIVNCAICKRQTEMDDVNEELLLF